MKLTRSTRCTVRFATKAKRAQLRVILIEYGRVTNIFIDHFWDLETLPIKAELLKPIVDIPETWLSARLRKTSAREALSMITAARKRWGGKAVKPTHRGKSMYVSSTIAELQETKETIEFDYWLKVWCIGKKIALNIPIKAHRHFNRLAERGKRLNSYIISNHNIQFAFEIRTEPKRKFGTNIGIDTGINVLAALSDERLLGTDIKEVVDAIKSCKHGSRGQKRRRCALKQRMDEVARDICSDPGLRLVVVERLRGLNKNTKKRRRLRRGTRRSLGAWAYRYWLNRVQSRTEDNRIVFRSVYPAYTSQRCNACGHTERKNRSGEMFRCRSCGHTDNAHTNASRNVLDRFLFGPYGAEFKPEAVCHT